MSTLYTPDVELVLEQGRRLLDKRADEKRPISNNKLAKDLGVSPASLSNFFHRKELGDVKKLAGLLSHWIDRERARDDARLLTVPFVETRQAQKIVEGIQFAHQYHRLVGIVSPPGSGKTSTIAEVRRRDPSIIGIQAANFFGPSAVLQEICEELRESQTGSMRALLKRIKHKLAGTGRCLIIDDTHKLRPAAMDTLQTVYDQTGIGIVLAGTRELRRMLTAIDERSEQMSSRVSGRIWDVPDVTENDLAMILGAVMPEDQVHHALDLLAKTPDILTSPRRLCNVLEISGRIAEKSKMTLNLNHLKAAMKVAA